MRDSRASLICGFVTIGGLLVVCIVALVCLLAERSGYNVLPRARPSIRMDKFTLDTLSRDLFFVWEDGHFKNYHEERKLCTLDVERNYSVLVDGRLPFDGVDSCQYFEAANETTQMGSEGYGKIHGPRTVYFNATSSGVYMVQLASTGWFRGYLYTISVKQSFEDCNCTTTLSTHSFMSDFHQTANMMVGLSAGDVFFVECEDYGVIFEKFIMKIFKLHG